MSLKVELETQAAALKAYDEQDFEKALQIFETIADTSKIQTNIGLIYATLGEHELAVDSFNAATELDTYLAVAYFQCGVSNFLLGRFEFALKDFEEALKYLRENQNINYEQLGLKFKLYSAEVLFNKGLCQIYLGDEAGGMADFSAARNQKVTPEHDVIDDAIRDRGEEYTVFSIPVGILYRPSETKLKNAKTKDYLGKAKLISAADANDAFTTFTGVTRFNQGLLPSGAPMSELNRSASTARPAPELGGRGLGRAMTSAARVENVPSTMTPSDKALPDVKPLKPSMTSPRAGSEGGSVGRSLTYAGPPGGGMGGPMRGGSMRRPPGGGDGPGGGGGGGGVAPLTRQMTQLSVRSQPSQQQQPPQEISPVSGGGQGGEGRAGGQARLTEIYDDYLDGYGQPEDEPPLPTNAPSRVAAWANKTAAGAPPPPSRAPSTNIRSPPSAFGGSGSSTGSLRRKVTRKTTGPGSARTRSTVVYEDEEEEGYASGDYEDGAYELTKIRVKIHYKDDVRGMTLSPEVGYRDLVSKVAAKFSRPVGSIALKFTDEDGGRVSLMDDSDYDLALETARESAKGKPEGKLEVWAADD